MRRAIPVLLAPVALAAAGYGFSRAIVRYFDHPLDVLDRIGMETNEYIDRMIAEHEARESAGTILASPGDSR